MKKLEETGLFKKLTGQIRLGGDIVDMIPDVTFLSDAGSAGLAVLAAAIDTTGALIKRDIKGAGEEIVCGAADAGVALIPFAEYSRLLQLAGKAFGADTADAMNLRCWARYGASKAYNKALGGRTSSVFKEASDTAPESNITSEAVSAPVSKPALEPHQA